MQGCLIWPVNLQKKEIILKVFLLCCCSALWVIKVSCIRFTPAKIAIYNDLTFLFLKRAKKLMIWMLTSVRFHVRCILLGLVVLWIQEDLEAFQCLFACWIHVILCLHYTCVHIPCKHIFWLIDIKWSGSIPCCPESGSDPVYWTTPVSAAHYSCRQAADDVWGETQCLDFRCQMCQVSIY